MAVRGHDPERAAAAYLGGQLRGRRHADFEAHVVDCEECWREVELARRGRSLAEASREMAPASLRDRVRAGVATLPVRRRWPRAVAIGAMAAAVVAAGVVFVLAGRGEQPAVIDAALSAGRGDSILPEDLAATLPTRLGDLELIEARGGSIEGYELTQHLYRDAAGHVVSVFQSGRSFPVADGAIHRPGEATWMVSVQGVALFCADHPRPTLVAGDDAAEVRLAAELLGLR